MMLAATDTELGLGVVVVVGVAVILVQAVVLWRLISLMRKTSALLEELRKEAVPLIDQLATSVEDAEGQLERVDRLVGSAESISATVDATSRLAYRALSAPVIKTVAATTGASRAAKKLRKE